MLPDVDIRGGVQIDCLLGDFTEPGVTGDPLLNVAGAFEGLFKSAGALEVGGVGGGDVGDVVSGHFIILVVLSFKRLFFKRGQFLESVQFYWGLLLFYTF